MINYRGSLREMHDSGSDRILHDGGSQKCDWALRTSQGSGWKGPNRGGGQQGLDWVMGDMGQIGRWTIDAQEDVTYSSGSHRHKVLSKLRVPGSRQSDVGVVHAFVIQRLDPAACSLQMEQALPLDGTLHHLQMELSTTCLIASWITWKWDLTLPV